MYYVVKQAARLIETWEYKNKSCYLEKHVVKEPCKQMTASTYFKMELLILDHCVSCYAWPWLSPVLPIHFVWKQFQVERSIRSKTG